MVTSAVGETKSDGANSSLGGTMTALSRCIRQSRLRTFGKGGIASLLASSLTTPSDNSDTSSSIGGGYWKDAMEVILTKPWGLLNGCKN